jgi:MoaA/NifB/PqqE/SkfB family radical SAM enzyme
MEVHGDGSVFPCCPRYNDVTSFGNIFTHSPEEVWNSPTAQDFRAGILDGTFRRCSRTKCPYLSERSLPRRSNITDPYLRSVIDRSLTVAPTGPHSVKLAHDTSCNLSCPSCRDRIIVAKSERVAELDDVLERFILPILKTCAVVDIAGDGDPFASKHYRDIMQRTADLDPAPRISLHTNGVLCDRRNWELNRLDGRVETVLVSIDAATRPTYEVVRRGGDFDRLMENLHFLAELRAREKIRWFTLAFVVQHRNFREMPEFVDLGRSFGADRIVFSLIYHWPRGMSVAEFAESKVWDPSHRNHAALLAILRDPRFGDPGVVLGDVAPLRVQALRRVPVWPGCS